MTACELGFGQGMSANLHAAASPMHWYGTDFNPSHASFARELSEVSGCQAVLVDEGFEQFCVRPDLPDFDFIGLHGIWSWISDANRAVIVDFVRRKLKVGGVLYISYNTQPGWASMLPMRDLLAQHAEVLGSQGAGVVKRVEGAIAFAEQLLAVNPAYARAHPQIVERLKKIKEQDRHYLAHEYFNRDWRPMAFAQLARWLEPAKVQWACSAHFLDALDAVHLTPDQQALLAGIPDPVLRQTVRDFCVNQQFRKDYWVKGARNMTAAEQAEALRSQRVVLARPHGEVSLKVASSRGEAALQEAIYGPLLDVLADHQVRSLGTIEQKLKASDAGRNISFAQLMQATLVLGGTGVLLPAQDEDIIHRAESATRRLNAHLLQKARSRGDLNYLASPVTGSGISVPRFQQLFILARQEDLQQPQDWAQWAWQLVAAQGQRLVKDGKPLERAEDNLAELTAQAQAFARTQLPMLEALEVV